MRKDRTSRRKPHWIRSAPFEQRGQSAIRELHEQPVGQELFLLRKCPLIAGLLFEQQLNELSFCYPIELLLGLPG
jgi:hypothetical protein